MKHVNNMTFAAGSLPGAAAIAESHAVPAGRRDLTFAAALRVLAVGTYFGVVLAKSEVARWQRVHDMFLFREAYMYLIIGTAIVVAMLSIQVIKRAGLRDASGLPIRRKPKPYHAGVILGGMLFGAGWAITGACPGPIYVQLGAGQWPAIFTFGGALAGMYTYALLKPRLPH
jgi:uncharacterized membrane protein YedE/YeeE